MIRPSHDWVLGNLGYIRLWPVKKNAVELNGKPWIEQSCSSTGLLLDVSDHRPPLKKKKHKVIQSRINHHQTALESHEISQKFVLRMIPTLKHYSDIASDIPPGYIYIDIYIYIRIYIYIYMYMHVCMCIYIHLYIYIYIYA